MDTRISSWCSASGPCPDGNSPVGSEVINSEWGIRTSMSTMRAETLDNGLLILLAEQHTVPVATFWVWYRVGSRNEMPGLTGISHWVEHMLFKGTPTHPKGMLTRHIDRLGGRWNAFTWKDYTAYHEVLPADHLGVAITLEADRMINTVMEPAEVESERTVIISEREVSCLSPAGGGRCRGAQGASVPDSCHWVEGRPAGDHPGRSVPPLPDVLSSQQRRRGRGRTV